MTVELVSVGKNRIRLIENGQPQIWELAWVQGSQVALARGEVVREYTVKRKHSRFVVEAELTDEVRGGE